VNDWPESQSLLEHARLLFRQPSARVLSFAFVAASGVRIALGRWSWLDVLGPVIIVALEPFTEWLIHVHLLHFRTRSIGGRVVDPLVARKHRAHHAAPRDMELVLIPRRVLRIALPAAALVTVAAGRGEPASITALAFGYGMFLAYEWTHFLIHSKYRPRHAYFRLLWRHHRNHHFRNEHYWFGVTTDVGDRVLRTRPERDAVPVSATARNLAAGWE
jgi:sterol desaturase/sphingolipid hydroxylase (fatty acid hydroxylase superfamily)